MANTLPPITPEEQDERYNPAKSLYEAEFNAGSMSEAEKQRLRDIHQTDQMEAANSDPSQAVREREDEANSINYEPTGKPKRSRRGDSSHNPIKSLNLLKRGSPMALIIGLILGGGALTLGSFALLPVHIYQNFIEKYDSQNTSYTIRTNKVLAAKLTNNATEGICNTPADFIKIRCRFSRPSNYMLKQLEVNNIIPLDKNGNKIEKKLLFQNTRPASFQFDPSGNSTQPARAPIEAGNLLKTLQADSNFRAAFHSANKTRLQTFSDSVFKRVAGRFGFTKQDKLKDAKTEVDIREAIDDNAKGADTGAKNASESNDDSKIKQLLKKLIGDEAKNEASKLASSGRGDAIGLAAGAVCLVADVPGIYTRTAAAYQMGVLIRFAMVNIVAVNAIMAGDGTPEEATAIGNSLTQTVNGKSALDSFGMKYSLYNDTTPEKDDTYQNFVPGGKAAALMGAAVPILTSDIKRNICAGATSPVTGVAINAALAGGTLGVGAAINIGVGILVSVAIEAAAGPVIDLVLDSIPADVYQDAMKMFFGDITANVSGMDFGNALASGAANSFGQVANAGGNMPLSVSDAIAYNNQTQAVNYAYAEEDRSTFSPLDASNTNTFMGSVVHSMIPLYSQMGSLTSILTSVGSIARTSASSVLVGSTFAASNNENQYKLCTDPSLTNINGETVAAGPFCNIQYGIPTQYLDMDTQTVVDTLVEDGQVDEDTGEPIETASDFAADASNVVLGTDSSTEITSLYKWMELCSDGTSSQAVNCQIKDQKTAMYAIYTIDHRIQKNMDDEDTDPEDDSASPASTAGTGGSKQELAKAILDSGKVSFIGGDGATPAGQRKIFSDIADGASDGNSTNCGLNIKVLQLVKTLVDAHSSIGISDTNSLCLGVDIRSHGSRHWGGNGSAIDFYMLDGVILNGSNAKSLELLVQARPLLSQGSSLHDESQVGQVNCRQNHLDLGNVIQINDSCNHVHIDFPPWSDPNLKIKEGTGAY